MASRTYRERLAITGLESLELRRLRYDLTRICVCKILSGTFHAHHAAAPGLIDINTDGLFTFNPSRGHPYKLYKQGVPKLAELFCMQNYKCMEVFTHYSICQLSHQL